jgi:hypothetical protein
MGYTRRARRRRTVKFQWPSRTVRPAGQSLAIWTRRRTTFALWAGGWTVSAALISFTQGGRLVVSMCLVAAFLSAAASLKAILVVSRARRANEGVSDG